MVAGAANRCSGPGLIRRLFVVGGAAKRPLFHPALPLTVLLALPGSQLRAPHAAADRLVVEPVSRVSGVVGTARLPSHLLLLPQGLLSLVLPVATRLRGSRPVQKLHRRNAISVRPAEHPSLFLLALNRGTRL